MYISSTGGYQVGRQANEAMQYVGMCIERKGMNGIELSYQTNFHEEAEMDQRPTQCDIFSENYSITQCQLSMHPTKLGMDRAINSTYFVV